jgi:hypothetical protein
MSASKPADDTPAPKAGKTPKTSMKIDEVLRHLEEAAAAQSIKVSYEAIGGELGAGGLCKVKGEYRVIIDKRATTGERVALVAGALARFPLENVFLPPEVRELVDRLRRPPGAAAPAA